MKVSTMVAKTFAGFSASFLLSSIALAGVVPSAGDITALKADLITAGGLLIGIVLAVYSVKVIIGLFSK